MTPLADAHFVALARKVGHPAEAELHRLRKIQLERQARGEKVSLFEVACLEKALDAKAIRHFDRWAAQIAQREPVALEDEDSGQGPADRPPARPAAEPPAALPPMPETPAAPRKKRVLHKSAAAFSTLHSRCCRCGADLDEFALLEGRASEVEDGVACTACFENQRAAASAVIREGPAASPAESKTPSGREANAPALSKTPSAASKTPSAPSPAASAASKTPSGRPLLGGTPSKRRIQAAPARPVSDRRPLNQLQLLVGVGVVVVLGLVVALVALATSKPSSPEVALASPAPIVGPSLAPSSRPSPRESGEPGASGSPIRVADEAGKLARQGRYREALERVDAALARATEPDATAFLKDARERVVAAFRQKLDEAKELAEGGAPHGAKKVLARLRLELPDELEGEIRAAEAAIDAASGSTSPDKPDTTETPDPDPDFSPPPRRPVPSPSPGAPPPPRTPKTGSAPPPPPDDPGGRQPAPVPSPGEDDDDPNEKGHVPDWTDDPSASLPWAQAYTLTSKHYVIKTSVSPENGRRYQKIMEQLAERYEGIFPVKDAYSDRPSELVLYGSHEQYARQEPEMAATANGFYNPGRRVLVTYHGKGRLGKHDSVVGTLAHEATHQFEHRWEPKVFDTAPSFIIEGAASFCQTTRPLPSGELLVGCITERYYWALKRAYRADAAIPIAKIFRTPHKDFGFIEYAHAWALFHWMFYGPEAEKKRSSRDLLNALLETCHTEVLTADLVEAGFARLGYTPAKLDKALKDWVLSLDLQNDPLVLYYEKKTGKKVPR